MLKRGKVLSYFKNPTLGFIQCEVQIDGDKIVKDCIVCGVDSLNWRPSLAVWYPVFSDKNNKSLLFVGYQTLELTDSQGIVYKVHTKDDGSVKDYIVEYMNEAEEIKTTIYKDGNIGAGIGEIQPQRTLHTKTFRLDQPESAGSYVIPHSVPGVNDSVSTIGLNINGVVREFLVKP